MRQNWRKWATAVLLGLALVAVLDPSVTGPKSAHAQPAPDSAPAGTDTPSAGRQGAAAWQALVGNTAVARSRAGGYTEFYGPDGAVTHLDKDGKTRGKWSLDGQKVCFDFPEEDDRSCVLVEIDGDKGAFVDEDASRDTFQVLPGNAKGL